MILCVSDFSEENRTFVEANEVYEVSLKNIKEAYLLVIESTLNHLKKQGIEPVKEQKEVYRYYKEGRR